MKSLKVMAACAAVAFALTACNEEADVIKIGSIGPLSGPVAVYGSDCKNGIDLAVAEINAAGGINGKQIKLIVEDDEGDSVKSQNAYRKLVTSDKVNYIIGSLTSGCTQAITSLAEAQGTILIAPAATAENITIAEDGSTFKNVFRACFIDPFQGTVGAKFSSETLGSKSAAILYDIGNDYSAGLTENFVKTFEALGGKIVAKESYNTGDKDFNAQITKVKNANPDVVYLPDYYGTVALIANQLRGQGVNIPIVGADGWDGLTENAGDEVLNGYYSNHYAADSTDPAVQKVVNAYKAKNGLTPTAFAILGYDSVYMLKDAVEAAAKNGKVTNEAVRVAMEKIDGNYVTGHLTFNEKHNPVKSAVMVELVKNAEGKLTTVYKTTVNP